MSVDDDLVQRLRDVGDADVERLLRRLLLEVDPEPAITEEELTERTQADRSLLNELTVTVEPEPDRAADPRLVLVVLAQQVPDLRPSIDKALATLRSQAITLDFGATLALGVIVVAVAGAILRPRVKVKSSEAREADKTVSKREVEVEVRGIKDVNKLLEALRPFL